MIVGYDEAVFFLTTLQIRVETAAAAAAAEDGCQIGDAIVAIPGQSIAFQVANEGAYLVGRILLRVIGIQRLGQVVSKREVAIGRPADPSPQTGENTSNVISFFVKFPVENIVIEGARQR